MTKLQKLVKVSEKYKINSPVSARGGWGVPFPQKVETVYRVNASLMEFAFSFLG